MIFQQRFCTMIKFHPSDTVKTTPFAFRFLKKFLPNLSSDQWFYCLFADRKYFASKENQPFSRIEDVYEGICPFWRPLGPLPSVTHTHGQRLSRPKPPPPSRRKFSSRGRAAAPPHSNIRINVIDGNDFGKSGSSFREGNNQSECNDPLVIF